jgi:quercetin 2,3-dioxygenase
MHTREDEIFLILRGRYRFWQAGAAVIDAPAGALVQQHRGMVHQYRNVSDEEGEHILFCLPAGLEALFVEVARLGLVTPRDMSRVATLSAQYGLTYYPPIAK